MIQRARAATRDFCRGLFRRAGYDVVSYSHLRQHELRRAKLFADLAVGFVLDGGANRGQYARQIRRLGYRGEILSVEPLPGAFADLAEACRNDPAWRAVNVALGEEAGEATLYASEIAEVSSLFTASGASGTEGWQRTVPLRVPVRTIDGLLAERSISGSLVLKLDLQGSELKALDGAPRTIERACGLELELSTVPLYTGSPLLPEVVARLDALGFSLFSTEPALVDHASGRVLQLDALFVRP